MWPPLLLGGAGGSVCDGLSNGVARNVLVFVFNCTVWPASQCNSVTRSLPYSIRCHAPLLNTVLVATLSRAVYVEAISTSVGSGGAGGAGVTAAFGGALGDAFAGAFCGVLDTGGFGVCAPANELLTMHAAATKTVTVARRQNLMAPSRRQLSAFEADSVAIPPCDLEAHPDQYGCGSISHCSKIRASTKRLKSYASRSPSFTARSRMCRARSMGTARLYGRSGAASGAQMAEMVIILVWMGISGADSLCG